MKLTSIRKSLTWACIVLPLLISWQAATKTQVLVVGTIHGGHRSNPQYSFEDLYKIIDTYQPDVIGIEIRPEDMSQPMEYLEKSYPPDMLNIKKRYTDRKIVGFDWLGKSLEGKLIPKNYWTTISPVKKLQRELDTDKPMTVKLKELDVYDSLQRYYAKNSSAIAFNTDGKYDSVSFVLYNRFSTLTKGTRYHALSEYYTSRDQHIDNNIVSIIQNNRGKHVLIFLGADHKVFARKAIEKKLGSAIKMVDLKEVMAAD